jgi:hypothetical protein
VTQNVDIANRALQFLGSRTNMSTTEFNAQSSNEAIQTQLIMFKLRDELNRMAPWDCTKAYANLTYISSVPTSPENSASGPVLWAPGLPPPPWAYMYQYPVDCMRAVKIIPQYTALSGGVPIYPPGTATGAAQIGYTGPALKFSVATEKFFAVTAASVVAGGAGYAVGDLIILQQPTLTIVQQYPPLEATIPSQTFQMNVGAPAVLLVTGIGALGVVTSVSVVNQIQGATDGGGTALGGSYYTPQANPENQGYSTGAGTGASFNLTYTPTAAPQRVILTNQQQAILCYNTQITDPNIMDVMFQDAWIGILGARLVFQLTGNIPLANELIKQTNFLISEARKADGNEGITVNDVTPDFLRIRGDWGGPNWEFSPNMSFDWGSFYSPY